MGSDVTLQFFLEPLLHVLTVNAAASAGIQTLNRKGGYDWLDACYRVNMREVNYNNFDYSIDHAMRCAASQRRQ